MQLVENIQIRVGLHYLTALAIMNIYGFQVCPFIEGLTLSELLLPLSIIVLFQYLLHQFFKKTVIIRAAYEDQVKYTFQIELCLFLLSGILLTMVNSIIYDFPVVSGFKMVLGFMTIGLFAATDIALLYERQLSYYMKQQNIHLQLDKNYFPLAGKFSLFSGAASISRKTTGSP